MMMKDPAQFVWCSSNDVRTAKLQEVNSEEREELLGKMLKSPSRELSQVPVDIMGRLDEVAQHFPNFHPVIDWLQNQLALCALNEHFRPLEFPPALIVGPPGIGKTRCLDVIAKALGVESKFVDGSSVTAGFVLSGSSPSWNKARQGLVLDQLLNGRTANPLFIVDELDKMGGDKRYPPDNVLLSLLEKQTAKQFRDEFAGVSVRAHMLNWVATANDLSKVSKPLLDRFEVLTVDAPTAEQARAVATSVYHSMLSEYPAWGPHFDCRLTDEVLDHLVAVPPRQLKRLLMSACGRAARKHSKKPIRLSVSHLTGLSGIQAPLRSELVH